MVKVLGLDIGGANLKLANIDGDACSVEFPMWTHRESLADKLRDLVVDAFAEPDIAAITMSAELADCFQTKAEGVEHIIRSVQAALPKSAVRVWLTSGEFAEPEDAMQLPELVAAGNWHVLATWAGRAVPDCPALLVDIGSTTTDIIPLLDGRPVPAGLNDRDRLLSGELVYTGAFRTPVCAVAKEVPLRERQCAVAAELFATVADAFVMTGDLLEDKDNCDTADGRPLTRLHSANRLAHMVCCDSTELGEEEIMAIALSVVAQQRSQLSAAVTSVLQHLNSRMAAEESRSLDIEPPTLLISGSGTFVARQLFDQCFPGRFAEVLSVSEMHHRKVSDAACAYAIACLGHDLCRDDLLETGLF